MQQCGVDVLYIISGNKFIYGNQIYNDTLNTQIKLFR